MEKWCLLGVSRGLGREFAVTAARALSDKVEFLLSSRKTSALEKLAEELKATGTLSRVRTADFAAGASESSFFESLEAFAPNRIFYFAGGGPYGGFENKEWKDHEWSWNVNFRFPARLLHESLKWPSVEQWIFTGSSVAEQHPDPLAASYAAGKHALFGLISSLRAESKRDVRLFSPGYMDSPLLPPNAKARQLGELWPLKEAAEKLWDWSQNPSSSDFHLRLPAYRQ
jgi:short-subunit dehydrogenase